jgi:hypothetical protein
MRRERETMLNRVFLYGGPLDIEGVDWAAWRRRDRRTPAQDEQHALCPENKFGEKERPGNKRSGDYRLQPRSGVLEKHIL